MPRPTLASHEPLLRDLRVLVVGAGRSGIAAARLAAARGARVVLADRRPADRLGAALEPLAELPITVRGGGHPPELAEHADLIVVSPGVPSDDPLLDAARRLGVPVWGEIELAARFCQGRIVGVTGSNGKSTVTSMTGAILRSAGYPGGTGGNLGTPLADLLAGDGPDAVHAVELSSFQLETVERLRATVAVIVNLSPDHLDRYGSYAAYARAKARLLEIQHETDHAVLNADDLESRRFDASVRGRLHRFSTTSELDDGAFLRDGHLVLRTAAGEDTVLDRRELSLPGEHNVANALAAALACRLIGCPPDVIADALRRYRPLAHRLEHVGTLDGIDFYDDSKATNVDAATRAVSAFPGRGVHVILGGRDKGADWAALAQVLRRHARRALLVGEAADAIEQGIGDAIETVRCGTVPAAVREAFVGAQEGDVVLLSPACASFDQYGSFEERGDDFRRAVRGLRRDGGGVDA